MPLAPASSLVECPLCEVLTKKLQKHMNKAHIGDFCEWPRQVNSRVTQRASTKRTAGYSRRSAEVKCCICGITVSRGKREHCAPRPPARVRSANVPSSLGRLSTIKIVERRDPSSLKSVWSIPGGLPDTKRSKH
jgi:hypothetical protein